MLKGLASFQPSILFIASSISGEKMMKKHPMGQITMIAQKKSQGIQRGKRKKLISILYPQ